MKKNKEQVQEHFDQLQGKTEHVKEQLEQAQEHI